ncbi:MAG TPA: hypothetical protein VGE77_05645, partial [Nocardioides sp.]
MNIDDAAVQAWAPGLVDATTHLPADRRVWRINRSGVRGLLATSSAGVTWTEQGGLVTRPFDEVTAVEFVGLNGVVLHVRGLMPARLTFPDVRDRDLFEQAMYADRAAVRLMSGQAVPVEQSVPVAMPVAVPVAVPVAPVAVPVAAAVVPEVPVA